MEMTIVATHAGRVREVLVATSTHVEAGAPLVTVEPRTVEDAAPPDGPRIGFDSQDKPPHRSPVPVSARAVTWTPCAA